jgi:peptide-methionine (S)-S-oxide reductase
VSSSRLTKFLMLAVGLTLTFVALRRPSAHSGTIPAPSLALATAAGGAVDTAVFAGGCFWGIEAVYEHVRGVSNVVSGYAGGIAEEADYDRVSAGTTGHAESVRVIYDPSQVSYAKLLQIFFSVAHDPTQLNRQGPDVGPQYRSAIFFRNDDQQREAKAYVDQLTTAKAFGRPIVTEIVALQAFYPAEAYHQDFAARHPRHPYIVINDRPKVEHLRTQFPDLYRADVASR